MATENRSPDMRMDPANLYREDVVTDRRTGTIRVLTPVTADGSTDLARTRLYIGEAQILTPMGALPIAFEIEATSLGEAAEKFAAGAKVALEQAAKELQQMRREASTGLVIADRIPGAPSGGKIQLP